MATDQRKAGEVRSTPLDGCRLDDKIDELNDPMEKRRGVEQFIASLLKPQEDAAEARRTEPRQTVSNEPLATEHATL